MTRRTEHHHPARPAAGRRAFTLIELMVVLLIISVLAAIAVNVGKYMYERAMREQTTSTLTQLRVAVDKYYEITHAYPDNSLDGVTIFAALTASPTSDPVTQANADRIKAEVEPVLRKLPQEVAPPGSNVFKTLGNAIQFSQTAGIGGKPVFISGGPKPTKDTDGWYTGDTIRSDQ